MHLRIQVVNSTFFALRTELRMVIYEYIFTDSVVMYQAIGSKILEPPVMRTCLQFREDSAKLYCDELRKMSALTQKLLPLVRKFDHSIKITGDLSTTRLAENILARCASASCRP